MNTCQGRASKLISSLSGKSQFHVNRQFNQKPAEFDLIRLLKAAKFLMWWIGVLVAALAYLKVILAF